MPHLFLQKTKKRLHQKNSTGNFILLYLCVGSLKMEWTHSI